MKKLIAKRMSEREHNKRLHGTPQPYLSSIAGVGFCNFAGRQQLPEGAPVSRIPICAGETEHDDQETCKSDWSRGEG